MSLHVQTTGTGPRLVLLHGWALNSHVWDDIVERLGERFTVACVDLPGHGASRWPPEFRDLESLGAAIAPDLGTEAIVLGWSLGALAALQLALAVARQVRALVLVAATPRFVNTADWTEGVDPSVLEEFAARIRDDYQATVRDFLALQVRGDERAMETLRVLRRRVLAAGRTHPEALCAGLDVLRHSDLRERLESLSVPTLVIAGERDRLTPPGGSRELAARIRRARFALIERAAHAPFISHRDIFLSEVEQFLARLAPSRP
jgi:pimeloyl-[acyl-carrier protein] methyl ester esterase